MGIRRFLAGTLAVTAWLVAISACETSGTPATSGTPTSSGGPNPSSTTTRAPRAVPFFGLDVPRADSIEFQRVASVIGCQPSVVSTFVKLDSAFSVHNLRALNSHGATPFVTLEPWSQTLRSGQVDEPAYRLASVTGGSHDAALVRIARAIAAYGKPVYLRFAHEMNGDWYPWATRVNAGSSSTYVAAWQHAHDVMARAGAHNAKWVWSPAALATGPDGPAGGLSAMYPGDHYVDFVGFTGYGLTESAATTFDPWLADIAAFTSRPVILSEIGADGPHKVAWINSLGPYLEQHPQIAGFVWFNTTPSSTGASGYYRIDNSSAQVTAFRAVLARLLIPCSSPPKVTPS